MDDALNPVARYAMGEGLEVRDRTVLVEGTSDVALFELASQLECAATGVKLIGPDFSIVAAGVRERGGTMGVVLQLLSLRAVSKAWLLPNGRPRYRFVALLDNDRAGQNAVRDLKRIDSAIIQYKDLFLLSPVMPLPSNLDPGYVQRTFERENGDYSGLEWELEDLLPESFVKAFLSEYPDAARRTTELNGRVHRDYTTEGKAQLHRFVRQNAIRRDVANVVEVIKALRCYLKVS